MSNIYIQEPPTSGKVLLKTTVGDIDVELWTREAPKACRNFIQLCLEGYYNGTIFHRVVKGFIVQGGDPNGDGTGGESIYGEPFKDEFHTRLRFTRRGLLAMANAGKDDNASQFFFTMGATPELQNKHTIFGKVTGETIYNMLKLEDGLIDHDERPQYPNKILKTEVLLNPFKDIVPRVTEQKENKEKSQKKEKKTGVKNFKLLSFGEEAEEDEELASVANEKFSGKSKSTHDLLDDPKLSSLPAVETDDDKKRDISEVELHQEELENIRKKLKGSDGKKLKSSKSSTKINEVEEKDEEDDEEEEEEYYFGKDRHDEKKKKMENIRKEIRELKKDFQDNKKKHVEEKQKTETERTKRSETLQDYDDTIVKYAEKQKTLPKKGASREEFTLQLLKKFQQKLGAAKEKVGENEDAQTKPLDDEDEENEDDTWLAHKLSFADNVPVLARDANTKDDAWYDLNDPRNPINKRRREESKKMLHKKGGSGSGSSSGHSRHRR